MKLSERPQQWNSEQAREAGRRGGRVKGRHKGRPLSSDEARRRVSVRWARYYAEERRIIREQELDREGVGAIEVK